MGKSEESQPVRILLSYAVNDRDFAFQLQRRLVPLMQWERRVRLEMPEPHAMGNPDLGKYDLVIPLLSSDYFANQTLLQFSEKACAEMDAGRMIVQPVIIRSCNWKQYHFEKLTSIPSTVPVGNADNDEGWTQVMAELMPIIQKIERKGQFGASEHHVVGNSRSIRKNSDTRDRLGLDEHDGSNTISTNSRVLGAPDNGSAVTESKALSSGNPNLTSMTALAQLPQPRILVSATSGDKEFVTKFQGQIKFLQGEEPFLLGILDPTTSEEDLASALDDADIFIPFVCSEYLNDGRLRQLFKQACERMQSQHLDVAPLLVRPCHWKIGKFSELKDLASGHVLSHFSNDPVWAIVVEHLHGRIQEFVNKRRTGDIRSSSFEAIPDSSDPFVEVIASETPARALELPAIAEHTSVPFPPPANAPPAESAAAPDAAFMAPSNTITKPADHTRPCWFVGATWGGRNDQTSRFIGQGIWENRNDHYLEQVKSILPGDRIAIKATHTRKKNVPFDHRDHWVSVMTIKAIGVVKENVGDGRTLKVEWTSINNPRDWYLFTFIATVCRVLPGEWMSDALIAFTFDQQEQDIARFRNAPYWKQRFGDGPADDARFQWTKFYQAIADKLLDYKKDRPKLVAGIHTIVRRVDGSSYLDDQFKDGTTGPLKDICPFTAMGIFNRGLTKTNRTNIAGELAKFLGVIETVPWSFDGLPVLDNRRSWFFGYQKDRQDDDIDALWDLFEAALRFADSDDTAARPEFVAAYDNAIQRSGVGWNLTIALYWVRPWEFPTLDTKSRDYIKKQLDMKIGGNSGDDYLTVLEQLEARFRDDACPVHSFPELSLAALQFDTGPAVTESDKGIVSKTTDKPQQAVATIPTPTLDVRHAGTDVAGIGANEEKPQPPAPSKHAAIELWLSIHGNQAKLIQGSTETILSDDLPSDWANWEITYFDEKKKLGDALKEFHEWDEQPIKDFGDLLGTIIFGNGPQNIIRDTLASLPGGTQLRLVLDLDANAAMVPWEYIRWEKVFLIEQHVSIVRHVKAIAKAKPLQLGKMPREMLFAWANPKDTDKAGGEFLREGHLKRLGMTLGSLRIRPQHVDECNPRRLQDELGPACGFEVFHYLGHGTWQSYTDPVLILHADDSDGDSSYRLDVHKLATWLGNLPRKLVFLAACHSGAVPPQDPYSSLAREIARRTGTPVVAMQVSVPREFATEFSCKFYEHLASTRNIEKAVYLARQVSYNGSHAFGIPVLYADMTTAPDAIDLPERPVPEKWHIAMPTAAVQVAYDATPACSQANEATSEPQSSSPSPDAHVGASVVQAPSTPFPLPSIRAGQIDVSSDGSLDVEWSSIMDEAVKIRENYAFPESLIVNAVGELIAGRHLLLIGPVGTGKTSLARAICKLLKVTPMETTASADWTVFDVVGGYFPHASPNESNANSEGMQLGVRNGVFTEAVLKNWAEGRKLPDRTKWHRRSHREWLILDEMNRADMDRALGGVFTALESRRLRIPRAFEPGTTSTVEIPIPKDFRVIATMNAVDRHYLFRLSDALKRRFAFIEVPVTSDFVHEWNAIRSQCSELPFPDEETASTLRRFVYLVRLFYPLGTAQLLAAYKFLAATSAWPVSAGERLTQAIVGSVLPGLEDAPAELLGLLEIWASRSVDDFGPALRDLKKNDKASGQIGGLRLNPEEFVKAVTFALSDGEVGGSAGAETDHVLELAQRLNRRAMAPLMELGYRLSDMKRTNESGHVGG